MFNLFEELFAPGRKHTHEERKRLELSRVDVNDGDPGRGPIDLASGKVVVRVPGQEHGPDHRPRPDRASRPGPEADPRHRPGSEAEPERGPEPEADPACVPKPTMDREPESDPAPEPDGDPESDPDPESPRAT
ncbi:DUF6191 domain-containing protein [Streptomyces sp. NPDC002580]|uniref:DUF6191 domain-containing protein n=1 Tax=Streptomyces sp. NPDC002580 TaxID=3364653 RepID=UPI0036799A90